MIVHYSPSILHTHIPIHPLCSAPHRLFPLHTLDARHATSPPFPTEATKISLMRPPLCNLPFPCSLSAPTGNAAALHAPSCHRAFPPHQLYLFPHLHRILLLATLPWTHALGAAPRLREHPQCKLPPPRVVVLLTQPHLDRQPTWRTAAPALTKIRIHTRPLYCSFMLSFIVESIQVESAEFFITQIRINTHARFINIVHV